MSTETKARVPRRYEGRGIGDVRGPRSRVSLPGPDEATLLPDPRAANVALLDRFRVANGPHGPGRPFPDMSVRDLRAFANVFTLALRNDLPTVDPRDAAVLWEKWRNAIHELRGYLRGAPHDAMIDPSSGDLWLAALALDNRRWDLIAGLETAVLTPGQLFERFCPWRSDWATFERLHPEAV